MKKSIYIESKIDGQQYCKTNGQFTKHLQNHSLTYQEYYEKYVTGIEQKCQYCGKPKVFYQKNETYANTCGDKVCAATDRYAKITEEEKKSISEKRSSIWQSRTVEDTHAIVQRRKETVLQKYGVSHPMHLDSIKLKSKKTLTEKYGVSHHMKSEEFLKTFKDKFFEKHGVTHQMHLSKVKDAVSDSLKQKIYGENRVDLDRDYILNLYESGGIGLINEEIGITSSASYKLLRSLKIDLVKSSPSVLESEIYNFIKNVYSGNIILGDRTLLKTHEIDIYIPEMNLAIECNGAYWHSELNGRTKKYHNNKTDSLRKKGVRLIHIFDYEWKKSRDKIESIIAGALGFNKRIPARKTKIRLIQNTQVEKEFLLSNHLQGFVNSRVCYGLYYHDKLVALMSFGKSRFGKSSEWELLRYSSLKNTNIIGGASKLFEHFIKQHVPESIISYSDRSKFSGNMYKKMGLTYSHSSPPAYFYTRDYQTFENRIRYQKHKLHNLLEEFDPKLTEWENMQNNGYDRIWDCGNDAWVWKQNC